MQRVRVKICGITNSADAQAAIEAGADALGFMFYQGSPRCLSFVDAAEIIRALPPLVARVGVFVDATEPTIHEAITVCGLDAVQLHGEEAPDFCQRFRLKVIKAFRIRDRASLRRLPDYHTSAWLLDSYVPDQAGGSGHTFNWELAVEAKELGRPVILAGGLKPENVAEAVRYVRPYGVDVSSGVESRPGKKDRQKMYDFIASARAA